MRGGLDGVEDAGVRAAAAEVVLQPGGDRLAGGRRIVVEEGGGGEDHPRRAVAALEAAMLHEGLLDRMQGAVARQPLDGGDLAVARRAERGDARADGLAVDEHGAGAADPGAAAVLGAGQPQVGAEHPEELAAVVGVEGGGTAVESELDRFHEYLHAEWLSRAYSRPWRKGTAPTGGSISAGEDT